MNENKLTVRAYRQSDLKQIAALFYETVHSVNAADYTKEQLDAWADGKVDLEKWDQSFREHDTLVAVRENAAGDVAGDAAGEGSGENGVIIGFGDMAECPDGTAYLDRLYVHRDFQRQGTAAAICGRLEESVKGRKIVTHASVTAKPFFEKRGYTVVREQLVRRHGVFLKNYVMEKESVRE